MTGPAGAGAASERRSWQLVMLDGWLRVATRTWLSHEKSFDRVRRGFDAAMRLAPLPPGATFGACELGVEGASVPALEMAGPADRPVVLWFHGGAYCFGSPRSHRAMAAALAARIGGGTVLPDYRLAPEHRFPAAAEDALTAWRGLVARGVEPGRIVLGGDSAGGGLALGLLQGLIAEGAALPGAVVLFAPWTDLELTGASLVENARSEALLPVGRIAEIRDTYVDAEAAGDPRASPLRGDFRGGPPVLIQASAGEILRDDSLRMAARLEADGVAVTLQIWAHTPHVWQLFHGWLPEAQAALDRAADWFKGLAR